MNRNWRITTPTSDLINGYLQSPLICNTYNLCFQVPAGLFIPSMAIGACMGRVLGIGMEQLAL